MFNGLFWDYGLFVVIFGFTFFINSKLIIIFLLFMNINKKFEFLRLPPQATLESTFQLMLQLYILGTQYPQYKDQLQVPDVTLGDIFTPNSTDSNALLAKQVKRY